MGTLYHYTCEHGRTGLGDSGKLISAAAQIAPAKFQRQPKWLQSIMETIWLTDLDVPHRRALGLTTLRIDCDRAAYRYRVHDYTAMRWLDVRTDFSKRARWELECAAGAMPAHWWIAYTPVPVVYDPIGVADLAAAADGAS